jgi:hypothetical protein
VVYRHLTGCIHLALIGFFIQVQYAITTCSVLSSRLGSAGSYMNYMKYRNDHIGYKLIYALPMLVFGISLNQGPLASNVQEA